MPLVHEELRRLAHNDMRRERRDHTLQATALVNEAYLRLIELKRIRWQDRAHGCWRSWAAPLRDPRE